MFVTAFVFAKLTFICFNGHDEGATPNHKGVAAALIPSPGLSPASGQEEQSERLRHSHVKRKPAVDTVSLHNDALDKRDFDWP